MQYVPILISAFTKPSLNIVQHCQYQTSLTCLPQDGWFDLMVNGGGPVMLQFGRNPYSPLRLALSVPWNEVMVLAPVKLQAKVELANLTTMS